MSARPWLPGDVRQELKAAIDQRRRELVKDELPPPGDHGRTYTYRQGCRCEHCRSASAAKRRQWRQENLEKAREWDIAYAPRRNEQRAARRAANG